MREAYIHPGPLMQQGLLVNTVFAMAMSSGLVLTYVILVVLSLKPWQVTFHMYDSYDKYESCQV